MWLPIQIAGYWCLNRSSVNFKWILNGIGVCLCINTIMSSNTKIAFLDRTRFGPFGIFPVRSKRSSLSRPFGIFCLYVILTTSYLRVQTIETPSLLTDSSRALFKQIEIFSVILTVYFYCKSLSLIHSPVSRVPPRDFAFWAKSLRGQ